MQVYDLHLGEVGRDVLFKPVSEEKGRGDQMLWQFAQLP